MAEFDESKHPRDEDGKFTNGGAKEYRQNTSYEDIVDKGFTEKSKDDEIRSKAEVFARDLQKGNYLEIEELKEHPVVKWLEEKAKLANEKYGDTSMLPGREKKREIWKNQFLSMGSMQKQPDGRYKPNGPIKKEFKAVIVTGLPASGKSSQIVNPLSRDIGGFVFDNDEIKGLIDEFREDGAAAGAVHNESKLIQGQAFGEFLSGGERNGENLIIPKIGDDAEDLQRKLIDKLEAAGYDVEIRYNPAPLKDSMNRAVMRGITTGRIVPISRIEEYGDKPEKAYESFKGKINKRGNPYIRED